MFQHATPRRAVLGLLTVGGLTGCLAGGYSPEEQARLSALEQDGKALSASADALEERLMGSQAALEMWAELGRRHQTVSAVACHNQDSHLQSMLHRVSAAEVPAGDDRVASARTEGRRRDLPRLPRMAQASSASKHW